MSLQELLASQPHQYNPDGIVGTPLEPSGYTLDDLQRLRWGQPPRPPSRPQVRFWARDLESNSLRMIQGTLDLNTVEVKQTGDVVEYTVTGNMLPPVMQYLIPDEIEHEMLPVDEVPDDQISSELADHDGFQPLGTINPDDLRIETKVDFDRVYGRTIKTSEQTTIEFSSCTLNPAVLKKFFTP